MITAKEEKVWQGIYWVLLNIFMPLAPIGVRLMIVVFSSGKETSLDIVEVPDLIYYTIFMCIININMLRGRDTSLERTAKLVLILISAINIIFIVMYYYGDLGDVVFLPSIIFSTFTGLFAIVYKFCLSGGGI